MSWAVHTQISPPLAFIGLNGGHYLFVHLSLGLPKVVVDTAYETKRVRSVLEENMAARMSLESQRREDVIVYNREIREKSAAQKAKVKIALTMWAF